MLDAGAEVPSGAEGAGGAVPSRVVRESSALISLPEAAESLGRSPSALLGLALRDPDALPVFLVPESPGWAAVPWIADADARVPAWREDAPPWAWFLVHGPVRLPPDVLREVLATGRLRRLTADGAPVRAVLSQIGYRGWSIEEGVVEVDEATRFETPVLRCVRLCEDRHIGPEALLVDGADVRRLTSKSPAAKAPAEPLRDGDIVSEDRAARALPWRRRDAVAWLRREGLSVVADARRVVVWGAVLERLRPRVRRVRQRASGGVVPLAEPGRILD